MESNYKTEVFATIGRTLDTPVVMQEAQGELLDDFYESIPFFYGLFWGTILSLPIWAFILWLLI